MTPEERTLAQHMIDELEYADDLTNWEQDFLENVTDQFNGSKRLSEKQMEILTKIYQERTA